MLWLSPPHCRCLPSRPTHLGTLASLKPVLLRLADVRMADVRIKESAMRPSEGHYVWLLWAPDTIMVHILPLLKTVQCNQIQPVCQQRVQQGWPKLNLSKSMVVIQVRLGRARPSMASP